MREIKFSYSVIGDNTRENREWLEMLGYKPFMWDEWDEKQPYLSTMDDGEYTSIEEHGKSSEMCSLDINCIGNSPLFKAVSAMREDSDFGQWFTDGKYWFENNKCANRYNKKHMPNYRKATLTELQEKFKL